MNYSAQEKAELCDRFVKVFRGRSDVYGNAKGFCVHEPLTRAVFERHLTTRNPENHIGVYCMIGDRCSWGCIDIDGKDFALDCPNVCDPVRGEQWWCGECNNGYVWDWQRMWVLARNLHTVLGAKGVPAHIERSKNGFHVWVFPSEPLISAATMRRALMAACTAIGYSPKEVNPKAEGPRKGTKGYGNFVRLPYGGALADGGWKPQGRYFVNDHQFTIGLTTAVELADKGRASTANLEAIARLWTPPPEPTFEVDYDAGLDDEATMRLVEILDGKSFVIWRDGPLPNKDRSTTLAKLAHSLREFGLTAPQAFAVLKSADARWGKFQDRPEELGRLIERAYQ